MMLTTWLLLACTDRPPTTVEPTGATGDTAQTYPSTTGCRVPEDLADPTTIDETFDLIDALPGPTVDVPCVLEALARPLAVELTIDTLSAQPAASERSPRIFVLRPGLTLSVVPEGYSRPLLEFAEHHESGLTVKAELHFPVELPLDRDAAFERVMSEQVTHGTLCGLCHYQETEVAPGRWASNPLRPHSTTLTSLEDLAAEARVCDPREEPDRCAFLSAMFDHGPVIHQPFPAEYPTIYDQ